jgi:rhodanese-related sulfurtransferase
MITLNTIPASEFNRVRQADPSTRLIDVRTPGEFASVHAEGAVNVPLDRVNADAVQGIRGNATSPLYVICKSGSRAAKACEALIHQGMGDVISIEGGTDAWTAAGLPVVRGKGVISLERQVRIGAGFLALLGTLLGAFVHPGFLALSGFVGAGLIFAGVTNWCGMALMLAKAPWNQGSGATGASCSA